MLREAALVREMHEAGVMGMKYLYMGEYFAHPLFRERTKSILAILVTGFHVHSCRKMLYKGDYAPSYLVDPEDYSWAPLETCRPLLDNYHYACFSHPERSLDTPATSPGTCPHALWAVDMRSHIPFDADPTPEIPLEVLQNVRHVIQTETERGEVVAPVAVSPSDYAPTGGEWHSPVHCRTGWCGSPSTHEEQC